LRTGREVDVVDLSDTGSLVEGTARLIPGTRVETHIVTRAGRILVRSRVVRASVSRLDEGGVTYRCALAFEQPVDTSVSGYGVPDVQLSAPLPLGTTYPPTHTVANRLDEERLSA
jgi:hypothetical protein